MIPAAKKTTFQQRTSFRERNFVTKVWLICTSKWFKKVSSAHHEKQSPIVDFDYITPKDPTSAALALPCKGWMKQAESWQGE